MHVENEGNMKLPSLSDVGTKTLILYLYGEILIYTRCIVTIHTINNDIKTPYKVAF